MTEFQVYLWLMLDKINVLSNAVLFLGVLISLVIGVIEGTNFYQINKDDNLASIHGLKKGSICFILCLILFFILKMVPTTKQYAVIKVLPKITNSEIVSEIQKDMPEMYKMAKEYMKDMLTTDN